FLLFFFFFQAEDGIRDFHVTGVQTCALPISERVWILANDGTKIPISLVYRKDMRNNGGNPLLLYGYGSYGATIDPYFSSVRLSLLDRGFIYAIAHIRGGEYLRSEEHTSELQSRENLVCRL